MASIYAFEGSELAAGLAGCETSDEAILAAERAADRRAEDVTLEDDDGVWTVHPMVSGVREPATFVCEIGGAS